MAALIFLLFFVLWLGFVFFLGLMFWKIVEKTGYHGALGILLLLPVANIIMLAILAFKEWPIHKEPKAGEVKPSRSLPIPVIVAIVICAMLPIFMLLAAIAIPNLLRARLIANEAAAKASARTISTAIEAYIAVNNGEYPISESALVDGQSPFLSQRYNGQVINGYKYSVEFNADSYRVVAEPESCGVTGKKVIVIETGGVTQEKECK